MPWRYSRLVMKVRVMMSNDSENCFASQCGQPEIDEPDIIPIRSAMSDPSCRYGRFTRRTRGNGGGYGETLQSHFAPVRQLNTSGLPPHRTRHSVIVPRIFSGPMICGPAPGHEQCQPIAFEQAPRTKSSPPGWTRAYKLDGVSYNHSEFSSCGWCRMKSNLRTIAKSDCNRTVSSMNPPKARSHDYWNRRPVRTDARQTHLRRVKVCGPLPKT